jgi:hypothetical protein
LESHELDASRNPIKDALRGTDTVFPRDKPDDPEEEMIIISSIDPAEGDHRLFLRMLGEGANIRPDIELFTRLALARMGVRDLVDSPPSSSSPLPFLDRFRIEREGRTILIFLLDLDSTITDRIVEQVAAGVAARVLEGLTVARVLCILNDQNGVPFQIREAESISAECLEIAKACKIAIVKAEDLARLALGVQKYGWPNAENSRDLLRPGRSGRDPHGARKVGVVGHYYDKIKIVQIVLDGDVSVSVGDVLAFRLRDGFHQETITSLQQNHAAVKTARMGTVGLPILLGRNEVPLGWDVFLMPPPTPSEPSCPSGATETSSGQETVSGTPAPDTTNS